MGKRENKQLTIFDAVVIVVLGDIIGAPAVSFQIPLIFAMLVLALFLALERGFIYLIQRSKTLEGIIESRPTLIVVRGLVNHEQVHKEHLGTDELYSRLRLQGIKNLGQVDLAYHESSGDISVFQNKEELEGLSILPEEQGAPPHHNLNEKVDETAKYFCWKCGEVKSFKKDEVFSPCPRCKGQEWVSPEKENKGEAKE